MKLDDGPWGYCWHCARLVTAREANATLKESQQPALILQLDEHWLGAHLKSATVYGGPSGPCKGSLSLSTADAPAEVREHGLGFSPDPIHWPAEDKRGIPANGWGNT